MLIVCTRYIIVKFQKNTISNEHEHFIPSIDFFTSELLYVPIIG